MPNWMEENCWICIAEEATAASYDSFISALNVWINRPNVINKRVLGAVKVHNGQMEDASLPFICKDISTESLFIRELIPKTNGFVSSYEAVHISEYSVLTASWSYIIYNILFVVYIYIHKY